MAAAPLQVKVFTRKLITEQSTSIRDILVNYEIAELPIGTNGTYDALLQKCATYCHISPLYLPLFALWNPVKESWMKLGSCIDQSKECHLEFRVRYLVKSEIEIDDQKRPAVRWSLPCEGTVPFIDQTVTDYLYRQKREDFLLGRIELAVDDCTENDTFSVALVVAALDLLCISKMVDMPITNARRRIPIKELLPGPFRQRMMSYNYFKRVWVKTKFKHFLQYLTLTAESCQKSDYKLEHFQQQYLLNLETSAVAYGVEKYGLVDGGFVSVSADKGIVMHDARHKEGKIWCSFSELTDMSVRWSCAENESAIGRNSISQHHSFTVALGKHDGEVVKLHMKSLICTENLASCLNGYYQLLVDAHHYLCKDVCSPRLVEDLEVGCHGPISRSYAEELLKERVASGIAHVGDCVIRQSREKFGEYFANTLHSTSPLDIRNYMLEHGSNNLLGLYGWTESHRHETIRELLEACSDGLYQDRHIPINPSRKVLPKAKHKSNLIVRLGSYREEVATSQEAASRTILIDLNATENCTVSNLGNGAFTAVKRYAKQDETGSYRVFKYILYQNEAQQDHHIHRSFQESAVMLNRLNHHHIVKQLGTNMSSGVGIWLEYVPHQSINVYLQQQRNLETPWFLQILQQVARACHYLEEEGFAHGNLCGKNVLLQKDLPQPHVKIADPGVRTRRSQMPKDKRRRDNVRVAINMPILTAPWVAAEFCHIDDLPCWDRYPTIAGDKWSFGTTACEIFNWGMVPVPNSNDNYKLSSEMKEWYRNGDLATCMHMSDVLRDDVGLYDILSQCWLANPDKRPTFQKILREFGSALTGDYVHLRPERRVQATNTTPCMPVIDLLTYEDEKLTHIKDLGRGHFGEVGLFAYDQHGNGHSFLVAIKQPARAAIRQEEFVKEIETMKRLNHRYIVELLGITEPSERIVMEYLKNGSLADKLRKCRDKREWMSKTVLLQYSSQIAEGMMALQEKRLIHRDLALRNILVGDTGEHVKISDFGLSRFVQEDDNYYVGLLNDFPFNWYAPECLLVNEMVAFGFESDIWSYGITIWEMFSHGRRPNYPIPPFSRNADLSKNLEPLYLLLKRGGRLEKTHQCPKKVYDFLSHCWKFNKKERPTFQTAKTEFDGLIPGGEHLEC